MKKTTELLKLVQPDIENIEKTLRADLHRLGSQMQGRLMEILEYGLLSGGKRFRPLLAVLSSRLCGEGDVSPLNLAIAFEYLHLATLFHDDVIDQAETRRGLPSVCKKFGLNGAILAGDFLHARSMEIVGKYGGKEALEIFCNATTGMVDGEFLQLANALNYNQSVDDYFKAIEGKTALLISATTEIGGLLGGADMHQRLALRDYGRNLGYGFQIADDLLDYLGDEEKTGKTVGNDLTEGKMTLPLILTMTAASEEDSAKLFTFLSDEALRQKSFTDIFRLIEKYDGFAKSREKAELCIKKAISSLELFTAASEADIQALKGLALYSINRDK